MNLASKRQRIRFADIRGAGSSGGRPKSIRSSERARLRESTRARQHHAREIANCAGGVQLFYLWNR